MKPLTQSQKDFIEYVRSYLVNMPSKGYSFWHSEYEGRSWSINALIVGLNRTYKGDWDVRNEHDHYGYENTKLFLNTILRKLPLTRINDETLETSQTYIAHTFIYVDE